MKTPARLSISVFQTATCRAMGISIWKTSPSEMSLENKVRKMVAKKKKEKRERERERERERISCGAKRQERPFRLSSLNASF